MLPITPRFSSGVCKRERLPFPPTRKFSPAQVSEAGYSSFSWCSPIAGASWDESSPGQKVPQVSLANLFFKRCLLLRSFDSATTTTCWGWGCQIFVGKNLDAVPDEIVPKNWTAHTYLCHRYPFDRDTDASPTTERKNFQIFAKNVQECQETKQIKFIGTHPL